MKINQDLFYKSQGFWWTIDETVNVRTRLVDVDNIDGPYCLNCSSDLLPPQMYSKRGWDDWAGIITCSYCEREFITKETIGAMKRKVAAQYVVNKRAEIPRMSLDDPPAQVKVRDEDDTYFLAAKIGEKDGKRVGVVYFGEKTKDQRKKDYSQIFLDLDDEQVRFDKSNKHPKDILASLTVEFPNGTHEMKFKGTTTSPKK